MSTPTQQRPPQATIASWMVIIGSVIVVGTVWEQVGSLRSLESREAIEAFLADAPSGLGLDVESVISLLYVACLVAAGCAAASAILGWFVLQRHLAARIALSVLAVPLFACGLVVGGFISSVVAASVALLWMPPSREWFKTGTWTPPAKEPKAETKRPQGGAPDPWGTPPSSSPWGSPDSGSTPPGQPGQPGQPPPASSPYASAAPSAADSAAPPAHTTPFGAPPDPTAAAAPTGAPGRKTPAPRGVLTAFVLTAVFAALTVLMSAVGVAAMLISPDLVMEELLRQQPELVDQGVTLGVLRAATIFTGAVCIIWSVAAVALGAFVLRRREWARRGLMICAGAAAGLCLVSALGSPVVLLPAIAAIATVVSLRRPEVKAWFAGH